MVIFSCGFNLNGQLLDSSPIKCCSTQTILPKLDHNMCTENTQCYFVDRPLVASTEHAQRYEGNHLSKLTDVKFAQNCIYWKKDSTWNVTGQQLSHMPTEADLLCIQKMAINIHRTVGINCRGEAVQYNANKWHVIPSIGADPLSPLLNNAGLDLQDGTKILESVAKKRKASDPTESSLMQSDCKTRKKLNENSLYIKPLSIQNEFDSLCKNSYCYSNGDGSLEMESDSLVEDVQAPPVGKIDKEICFMDIKLFDDNTLFLLDLDGRLWLQKEIKMNNEHIDVDGASGHPTPPLHLFWPPTLPDCGSDGTETQPTLSGAPKSNTDSKLMSNCNNNTIISNKNEESPRAPLYPSITSDHRVAEMAVGFQHCLLLTTNGAVFTWGDGMRGQLGVGELCNLPRPSPVPLLEGVSITSVAAGGWHSLALGSCGEVYVWGWNSHGQLGLPCKPSHVHDSLDGDVTLGCGNCRCTDWFSDACGPQDPSSHRRSNTPTHGSSAPTHGSSAPTHGSSTPTHGSKDSSIVNVQSTPVMLQVLGESEDVVALAAGDRHSLFLVGDGTVWSCGWNKYGQRGLCCKRKRREGGLYSLQHRSREYPSPCTASYTDDVAAISGGSDHITSDYSRSGSVTDTEECAAAVSGSASDSRAAGDVFRTNVSGSDSCFSEVSGATSEGELTRVPLPPGVKNIWAWGWCSVFQT